MDGRRPSSSSRQARKEAASPYARLASPAQRAPSTPSTADQPLAELTFAFHVQLTFPKSRLGAMLSFLSPFRRKQTPTPAASSANKHTTEQYDPEQDAEMEQDNDDSNGQRGLADARGEADLVSTRAPRMYPTLPMNSSFSMPDLSLVANETPRFLNGSHQRPMTPLAFGAHDDDADSLARTSPQKANEELANFFRQKAERGDEPLTPIEQAGVLHLMQQAQADSQAPTAFTPNFRAAFSPGPSASALPRSTSLQGLTSVASTFGTPSSPFQSPASGSRRRRPMYVGAGYSSLSARRRRATTMVQKDEDQLDQGLLAGTTSVAAGKRRRMDDDDGDDGEQSAPPITTMSSLSHSSPKVNQPVTTTAPTQTRSTVKQAVRLAAHVTPAKPSPLWQVSKASPSPSPSPAKVQEMSTQTEATQVKTPTKAADIVMNVLREQPAPPKSVIRQEVLNPYDSVESPMPRIPRSRPTKPSTPRRTPARKAAAATPTKSATPAKELSLSEQLEKTMPEKLRHTGPKKNKIAEEMEAEPTPEPEPTPLPVFKKATSSTKAPKQPAKPAVEVMELSDSEDDAEAESSDEPPVEPSANESKSIPTMAHSTHSFAAPASSAQSAFGQKSTASAFSFAPASTPPDQKNQVPPARSEVTTNQKLSATSATNGPDSTTKPLAFGAATSEPSGAAVSASTTYKSPFNFSSSAANSASDAAAAAKAAAPIFGFASGATASPKPATTTGAASAAAPSTILNATSESTGVVTEEQARERARGAAKATLPRVSFSDAFLAHDSKTVKDASVRAVMDVVKGMSKSELPTFAL
ncbi:hypothetical protein OIO90_003105 [Microbotryomycetes sp. JL221]|nr:hypothetical protein OIO90_003105 [Microbotryomycetes sp. JL221]